jgi:peptidoglycan/xylan/chitin deacetylase (PgdA/CDA1 family)
VTFGAHSRTHADLTSLNSSAAEDEILGSKETLSQLVGSAVSCFAYPYGKVDPTVESIVGAHYRTAFGVEEGMNETTTPLTQLRRTMVQHRDSVVDVLLRARYGKSVLQRIRQTVTAEA